MSEFFLELFSEEIPAGLQKNLREKIFEDFKSLFEEKSIRSKKNFSFSTPNRLIVVKSHIVKRDNKNVGNIPKAEPVRI